MARVAEALRALAPDVVGLQEVPITRWRGDVAATLARALDMVVVHVPTTRRVLPLVGPLVVGLLGFEEGPAVLSRFPIAAHRVWELPPCRRRLDARVLLGAEVESPWGRLQVFSTHTARGDDCQLRRIGELVPAGRRPLPAIVTGDLNAGEGSPAVRALVEQAGWVDAFRAANPTAPGLTVWQDLAAPGPTVFRRVDYVFLVPGARVPGRVVASRVVLDAPMRRQDGGVLWPSDHYGVYAEIEVGTPAGPAPSGRVQ